MTKTRKAQARRRLAVDAARRSAAVPLNTPAQASGGFEALLESATQEILAVTYWFDPAPRPEPYPVTVRFTGHRVGVKGRVQPGDKFVQDETIERVIPGSGPISLTARVRGITPGEWSVTAQILGSAHTAQGSREQEQTMSARSSRPLFPRLWRRWAPSVGPDEQVSTCLAPFAHVPGALPLIWGVLVTLGMIVALVLQALVIAATHLALGPWWVVTLVAIAVGIVGAKVWYIVLHWRARRLEGWCIQGFIASAPPVAVIMLAALHIPIGIYLDVSAPGLLVAMAIGRMGCFLAGCCGGPPTASRFGVWSSDQRVGARRFPSQLLEMALALSLGLAALAAVLVHGPAGGAFLVAALAVYTLVRQGLLRRRAEPRKTKLGGLITAVLAALVLIAALVVLVQ
jgi:phosphatidylglycerol:prolipoprotein diacylglycerol transferase